MPLSARAAVYCGHIRTCTHLDKAVQVGLSHITGALFEWLRDHAYTVDAFRWQLSRLCGVCLHDHMLPELGCAACENGDPLISSLMEELTAAHEQRPMYLVCIMIASISAQQSACYSAAWCARVSRYLDMFTSDVKSCAGGHFRTFADVHTRGRILAMMHIVVNVVLPDQLRLGYMSSALSKSVLDWLVAVVEYLPVCHHFAQNLEECIQEAITAGRAQHQHDPPVVISDVTVQSDSRTRLTLSCVYGFRHTDGIGKDATATLRVCARAVESKLDTEYGVCVPYISPLWSMVSMGSGMGVLGFVEDEGVRSQVLSQLLSTFTPNSTLRGFEEYHTEMGREGVRSQPISCFHLLGLVLFGQGTAISIHNQCVLLEETERSIADIRTRSSRGDTIRHEHIILAWFVVKVARRVIATYLSWGTGRLLSAFARLHEAVVVCESARHRGLVCLMTDLRQCPPIVHNSPGSRLWGLSTFNPNARAVTQLRGMRAWVQQIKKDMTCSMCNKTLVCCKIFVSTNTKVHIGSVVCGRCTPASGTWILVPLSGHCSIRSLGPPT